jgi:hypothetical protein
MLLDALKNVAHGIVSYLRNRASGRMWITASAQLNVLKSEHEHDPRPRKIRPRIRHLRLRFPALQGSQRCSPAARSPAQTEELD